MSGSLFAPGKVFLAGEYAVLEAGRPALVAGVDRGLRAEWDRAKSVEVTHLPTGVRLRGRMGPQGVSWAAGVPDQLRFAAGAVALAVRYCLELGAPPRGVSLVYLDDLALAGRKIGLGGSAAACVVAVRATCAALERPAPPDQELALACAAHWAAQGGTGSGADVAAAARGGLLEVRSRIRWSNAREIESLSACEIASAQPLEVRALTAPPGLWLLLAFTGTEADTRALVGRVREISRAAPDRWRSIADEISAACEALRDALTAGRADQVLAAVDRSRAAMESLGAAAGAPIVTERLARACAVAAGEGAAGKPSGAGGGDCAVVLGFGDQRRERVEEALHREFDVLRVAIP